MTLHRGCYSGQEHPGQPTAPMGQRIRGVTWLPGGISSGPRQARTRIGVYDFCLKIQAPQDYTRRV